MKRGIIYKIRRKLQIAYFNCFSHERVSKRYFKIVLKYKLNLDNPKTFNEKIQWLKLYEWPNNDLVVKCSDKYKVRDYLDENGLQEYENKLLGVYDNANEINWDELPDKFVIKCNHGCAYNIICTDKSKLDTKKATKQLNKWLKEDFGKFNAEIHYSKIQPKIIAEEYLGDNLEDYKFFCFNGKFKLLYIAVDSESETNREREAFFDENGKHLDLLNADYGAYSEAKLPDNFKQLIQISEKLAKPFPFVRVDWYIKDGKTTFGELTFTPSGGMMKLNPSKYDEILGDYLDIAELLRKKKKNMSSGLVSIICPMHNGEKFVDETIACVLAQSYSDFELIIVDDNSSDNTVLLIKKYDDKRIKLFVNEENKGAAYSRNLAISKAQGKFIAFLDGDDLWKKDKLEKQIQFMEENKFDFTYTDYEVVDEEGKSSGIYFTGPKKVTHRKFLRIDYIGTSTVIYRKEAYPNLQIPNNILKRNDDAMWLLLSTKCDCYLMKGIYSKYRRNSGSISSGKKSKLYKYHVELYKKLYNWSGFRANYYALRNVFYYFLKQLRFRKKLTK